MKRLLWTIVCFGAGAAAAGVWLAREYGARLAAAEADRQARAGAASTLRAELVPARGRLLALESALADATNALAAATQKYKEESAADEPLRTQIKRMLAEQADCLARLDRKQIELHRLAQQQAEAREKISSSESAASDLRARLEETDATLARARQELEGVRADLENMKTRHEESAAKLRAAEEELRKGKTARDSRDKALDEEKTLAADLREKLAAARNTIEELKAKLAAQAETNAGYEAKIRALESRIPAQLSEQESAQEPVREPAQQPVTNKTPASAP